MASETRGPLTRIDLEILAHEISARPEPNGQPRPTILFRYRLLSAMSLFKDRLVASLVYAAPIAPFAAAVITVGAYPGTASSAIGAAIVNILAAWLALSFLVLLLGLANPDRVNATNYAQLRSHLDELLARYSLDESTSVPAIELFEIAPNSGTLASRDLVAQIEAINHDIQRPGPQWVTGDAYIELWARTGRAEAAELYLAPVEQVIAAADDVLERITNSHITNAKELKKQLADARKALQDSKSVEGTSQTEQIQHRATVCRIVRTVQEYRDYRWDGLLHARNHLLVAMAGAGLILYLLVWLAMVAGIRDVSLLWGATAIYLVGAIVGIFNRVYNQSKTSRIVDDYGFSMARLIVTPQLSGLAAIFGVVLVAMVTGKGAPILTEAFNLTTNPTSVLTAAIFGLTPSLVIDQLKAQTEKLKQELSSSRPTEGENAADEDD